MNQVLELIEGEPLGLIVAILVFAYVGQRAVHGKETLRVWGWRLALLGFIAYVGYTLSLTGLGNAGALTTTAFRGLLAGGLVLGVSWIVLSVGSFVFGYVSHEASASSRRRESRAERKQREEQSRRATDEYRERQQRQDALERDQREKKELREEQARQDQKRRDEARFDCECFYDLHRSKLAEHFSEARLAAYFERYLGDNQPADEVERRAEQLRATLQELLDQHNNGHKPQSITEINDNFDRQLEEINKTRSMDAERKANLLAYVERQREQAVRRFYEK